MDMCTWQGCGNYELDIDGELSGKIKNLLNEIHDDLFNKAWEKFNSSIELVEENENLKTTTEDGKISKFYWCGDTDCGKGIEEETGMDVLGICEDLEEDSEKVCIHCGKKAKHIASIAKTY